ncbi:hypothetical protein LFT45_10640 [Arthrobacter sp. FW305-BF8]|uniref:hypothetical protein n=1 Tax=Arthrobacter sp. FW305-BF8 TaxID=2879617 RepID=UPI001F2D3BE5|nr:hypothetical protein [Arthrobacter sp. FW305-BF8]UKA56310.1 hypothetical protein LFT45_10640 [Arthrobacter sp. FW305-BF8]
MERSDAREETYPAHGQSDRFSPYVRCEWLQYDYGLCLVPDMGLEPFTMWRYRHLLPVADGPVHYSLPIGGTPQVPARELRALGTSPLWVAWVFRVPDGNAAAVDLSRKRRPNEGQSHSGNGRTSDDDAASARVLPIQSQQFVPIWATTEQTEE